MPLLIIIISYYILFYSSALWQSRRTTGQVRKKATNLLSMGNSLVVEHLTLDQKILVRFQVSQPSSFETLKNKEDYSRILYNYSCKVKNNKNNNSYVFLYRNHQDEIKTTEHQQNCNLNNRNVRGKTLVISHESLYKIGRKMFLQYNFLRVIFLPNLLKNYHFLLMKEKKNYLVFPIDSMMVISNEKTCTIYHNNDPASLHRIQYKINGLLLDINLLESKCYHSRVLHIITILRRHNRYVFICNLFLISFLVFYSKYR